MSIAFKCDHCYLLKEEIHHKLVIYKGKHDDKPEIVDLCQECKNGFDEWLKSGVPSHEEKTPKK